MADQSGSFQGLLYAFVFFILFSVLILTIVNEQGTAYDKDLSQVTGGSLSINRFNDSLTNISTSVEQYRERFTNQNIFVTLIDVVFTGIWDVGKSMVIIIIAPFTLLAGILTNILGIPIWVTTTIMALIGLSIIFALWRLIKIGD